jgi:acetyltransferase-like isoleucine patch superfamily enzyme
MLIISNTAKISRFADIEDSVKGSKIIIEDGVAIDSFVKIKPAGGLGDLLIGAYTVINAGVVIYTGNGIVFGKFNMIGANSVFSAASHEFMDKTIPIIKQGFVPSNRLHRGKPGILVEDDVWIGANCTIHEGAHIKRGAVISAGSIVKGTFEQYGIYAGNPLKCLGHRR